MKIRNALYAMLSGILLLIPSVVAGEIFTYVDRESGVMFLDEAMQEIVESSGNIDCILEVPAVVVNGERFTARVTYTDSVPAGDIYEKFEFNWPSICGYFSETTVRVKEFEPTSGGHNSSYEYVITPLATCINGTFEAKVKVKGVVKCSAKKAMTVVSPD